MNLNNINALPPVSSVSDTDVLPISDNPSVNEEQRLRKVTVGQLKSHAGSGLSGSLTQNFTYIQDVSGGDTRITFYPTQNGSSPFQKMSVNWAQAGTGNPDFTFMELAGRIWFCDLDMIGDEVGIVIGSNGHPGLTDARGWTNSYSFTATKSDLNPATATAAQCAERINALINALTRLSTSEGHGLLR